MNKETLKKEAIKLKQQLAEIESKIKQLENMPLNYKLAEVLHSKLCHWNHADGCSWENYQSGHVKKKYLDKANDLIKKFPIIDVEILIEIIDAL